MRARSLTFFASLVLLVGAASAHAQDAAAPGAAPDAAAPAAPAPVKKRVARKAAKPAGEKPLRGGALLITNQREVTLVELTATPKGRAGDPQILAQGIEAGATASAHLAKKSGCLFDVSGSFSDESTLEAPNMDLCKDGRITLSP